MAADDAGFEPRQFHNSENGGIECRTRAKIMHNQLGEPEICIQSAFKGALDRTGSGGLNCPSEEREWR